MTNRKRLSGFWLMIFGLPLAVCAAPRASEEFQTAAGAVPNLQNGALLFQKTCADCHGSDGQGSPDDDVPRIAGQHARVIIRQLVDYRYDRRIDPQMQAIAARHAGMTAQQVADIAGYAAALAARQAVATGSGEYLRLGGQIYNSRCSACHGAGGEGNPLAVVPRLAGQHYRYLLRQFHDSLEGRRPSLAPSHNPILEDLDRDALQGLADLLSRSRAGRDQQNAALLRP